MTAIFLVSSASRVLAATNFYEGKSIRLIVGLAAGGGATLEQNARELLKSEAALGATLKEILK
ncbi:MAG: hypothetical protein ACREQV_26340 [Candidatus Binatia bacterium]